jgi:hypothetical protein
MQMQELARYSACLRCENVAITASGGLLDFGEGYVAISRHETLRLHHEPR